MTDFIGVYDNALDSGVCQQIIDRFESSGQKERGKTGSGVSISLKDSFDITLTKAEGWTDLLQPVIRSATIHLLNYIATYPDMVLGSMAAEVNDPTTGQRRTLTASDLTEDHIKFLLQKIYRLGDIVGQQYLQGQGGYHHWHSEIFPRDAHCETLHRVLLFMFYLNTVETGGETMFRYQNRTIEPVQGRMVIAPAGFTHTHKGNIPESGDKFILTSWMMFNRAETIQSHNS